MSYPIHRSILLILLISLLTLSACTPPAAPDAPGAGDEEEARSLLIYSGRNENLVGPLIDRYREASGVDVEVRYGGTAELAATILEEGRNSPADLFFAQDAGALGALADEERCGLLPETLTERVEPRFVSPTGEWIGVSGRARVLVYNTEELSETDLPASVLDLTEEQWRGRVGWAPTNGSFQAFVSAMRVELGEEETQRWLEGMIANDVQVYSNNTSIVEATGAGEISVGLVNHYYLYRFLAEDPGFPAANYHFPAGDVGSMINVAGACVLDTADQVEEATAFLDFMLSDEAQQYFADETNEYPLSGGEISVDDRLRPLGEIDTPDFDLGDIADLAGTVQLLTEVGALD